MPHRDHREGHGTRTGPDPEENQNLLIFDAEVSAQNLPNWDALSGGPTGNILSAVDIDTNAANVESVLIVAGQNELQRRMSNEEFVWINRKNEERLEKLGATKRVVVPPNSYGPNDRKLEISSR